MKTLTQLLQPYSLERFFSENWTQRAVVIPGETPDKFKHLFSWAQLNHLLNFHQLEPRFVLNEKVLPPCDPKEWVKRCQQGASLVVSHMQEAVPALADLAWALQQETGQMGLHANIYCSWPSKIGFTNHYDSHEVFVMQIDGPKEWFVFEETLKYPYRDEKSYGKTPPDQPPYIHTVLQPGDLLYIPRGHWHYAIAKERPSLHVTLGIRCFNGRDLLTWATQSLQETIQQQDNWRQNLPLICDQNTDEIEAYVEQLLDSLGTKIIQEQKKLTQKYIRCQTQVTTRAPEISLPGQVGFSPFEAGLNTVLRAIKFQTLTVEPLDETGYLLITPQKKIKLKGLPAHFMNTFVEHLLKQESFTIGEVADWLPECEIDTQILPLLAGLVQEGILLEDSSEMGVNSPGFKWSADTVKETQTETVMNYKL
ncbi:MAG: cupin domain-containing protein [Microcoleaceae cyanobacterium]